MQITIQPYCLIVWLLLYKFRVNSGFNQGLYFDSECFQLYFLIIKWHLQVSAPYLVITFEMSSIQPGQHLRALDNLLQVYGFNITYQITNTKEEDLASNITTARTSCSVLECRYLGHCYAAADFRYSLIILI